MTTAQDAAPSEAGQEPEVTEVPAEQGESNAEGNEKPDPWGDPATARKEIEKLRRESASYRTKLREAEPALNEFKKLTEASKTDLQRYEERATAAERERDETNTKLSRMTATTRHGIPEELVDLLGSGAPEEIEARAQLLAKKLSTASPAASSGRPVESLRPGAAPGESSAPGDANAWIRNQISRK